MSRTATRRGSKRSAWPERSPDKDTLEHFEKFCFSLALPDDGGPFRLEDWQLIKLEPYFAGVTETLWLEPTGAGKSTLLGALALHHATYVRVNARVFVLGGLGGHARNTLDAAAAFIDASTDLSRWWAPQEYGMGRIKSLIPRDRGQIIVTSAGRRVGGRGGSAQEGKEPTLILVEELHRHEDNGAAVRTLTSKLQKRSKGRHRVRIVHATTAGDDLDSPLGRLVKRATDVDAGAIVEDGLRPGEHYTRARDADGDLEMHRWAVPDEIKPPAKDAPKKDLDVYLREVKCANPASFVTLRNLRIMWKASSAEPWVFLRQNANQWVVQGAAAIDRLGWISGAIPGLEIPAGDHPVYVGLDVAPKWDTTAIVPVWVDPVTGRPRTAGAVFLKSTVRGTQRRMRNVIDVLEVMRERWPNLRLVFDRAYGGGLIAEQFEEDHGLVVVDHSQGVPFELASMLFAELVDQHGIDHDGDPGGTDELSQHVLACVARRSRTSSSRWRIDKPDDGRPIDGADALVMAANIALNPPPDDLQRPFNADDFRIEGL